ncbi:hypothetical protein KHQ81_08570 [Mycoplasmatota bacterium]|nr:hypothetical protein KHQ81_08570 [Mycoplasmatota bacterium]
MGDNIFYWMLSIILILLICIPLAYSLGLSTGFRNGFQDGYENNPLVNNGSQAVSDIIFLLENMKLDEKKDLSKIYKLLNDLDKSLNDIEKK